ncbi:hypothetical protein C8Q74DRAFT_1310470 [Fomes fomentarius]|nr:hypothetical protein C8Q74DRAFT_1310470 [Fomes fomentarius]
MPWVSSQLPQSKSVVAFSYRIRTGEPSKYALSIYSLYVRHDVARLLCIIMAKLCATKRACGGVGWSLYDKCPCDSGCRARAPSRSSCVSDHASG